MLTYYEAVVAALTLVPSSGGRCEVRVDGDLIFSKQEVKRHIEPGEVVGLLKERAARLEQGARTGYLGD